MKVLIVGGGGREHAIAMSVSKSSKVTQLFCAPGNAGIANYATCVPIKPMDFDEIRAFSLEEQIDLVVVAMDDPLVAGLVDVLEAANIRAFGPNKAAAIIEGSKTFAKDLMKKYEIPTAEYQAFKESNAALEYVHQATHPVVIKADGLALGKGVYICSTVEESEVAIAEIMLDRRFGDAGTSIVIEEYMTGREVSVLAFVDGTTIKTMSSAQDHKRVGDGDTGPNTGGMGVFSPSPYYTKEIDVYCQRVIFKPTVDAMKQEGREFKGVLYFGLMMTEMGPKVVEYNARFGDPEAQVILPRLQNDIIDVFFACMDGTLDQLDLEFSDQAAVGVVLASAGYPASYHTGTYITGLELFQSTEDVLCFHAGTAYNEEGQLVTNGGRVFCITALARDLKAARERAYEACKWVEFDGKYQRSDIGIAFL